MAEIPFPGWWPRLPITRRETKGDREAKGKWDPALPPRRRPSKATARSGRQRERMAANPPRKVGAHGAVLAAGEKRRHTWGQFCHLLLPPAARWTWPVLVLMSSELQVCWRGKNRSLSTDAERPMAPSFGTKLWQFCLLLHSKYHQLLTFLI